jgi:YegS/Rv2252/BmrU family lipid kinase
MKVTILMNDAAGLGAENARHTRALVEKAVAAAGLDFELLTPAPGKLAAAARNALQRKCRAVVAAGGDGTVSAVASGLIGSGVALGVLPTGTLNHFARDNGVPSDLHVAARILGVGRTRNVDVGQVNHRYFINNSSIGLYPQLVWHRHQRTQRFGRGKWIATGMAAVAVFRQYPVLNLTLEANGQTLPRTTPFVFIGNNRYDISLLSLGARSHLDRGELGIYLANRSDRFALLRMMFRALMGRLNQTRDFQMLAAQSLRIEAAARLVQVALDGELCLLTPPLEYRILPRALNVIVP